MHEELYALANGWRDPIARSGHPNHQRIEAMLVVGAQHLASASFGEQLHLGWYEHGAAIEAVLPDADPYIATPTLVFAGTMSALDLCAAALARWCRDEHEGDKECAMGCALDRRRRHDRPDWATTWLTRTAGDARWPALKAGRDHLTHRVLSRSTSVYPPTASTDQAPAPARSWFNATPDGPTVEDTYRAALVFAVARWRAFWTELAADASRAGHP